MNLILERQIYKLIRHNRKIKILNFINRLLKIENYNKIDDNLYLGNCIPIKNNNDFIKKYNICAIVNCTGDIPFPDNFDKKNTFRLSIEDSREDYNLKKIEEEIENVLEFINKYTSKNENVYVHCFWGLMRSATIISLYLIKKYSISYIESNKIINNIRPYSLNNYYNFNDILEKYEKNIKYKIKNDLN